MHLTLKFFGETPEERIDDICEVMKAVADKYSSFSVLIDKTGIFGSSYNPRVIWLGIGQNEMLIKLAEELFVKLDENGFERDRQNFVPHLTLARIKEIQNKKHFQAVIDKVKNNTIQEETIGKLSLYESILKPSGAVYVELKSFMLGKENK
jgi:2'-5' RNA ligase